MDDTKAQIRAFLERSLGHSGFGDEEDIFGMAGVTSLFAIELVLHIEEAFGVALGDNDLDRDNLRSVRALVDLVERKRRSGSG